MIEHTAFLNAGSKVRLPNKDPNTSNWYVNYQVGNEWKKTEFPDSVEAWRFYYKQFNSTRDEILAELKKVNSK